MANNSLNEKIFNLDGFDQLFFECLYCITLNISDSVDEFPDEVIAIQRRLNHYDDLPHLKKVIFSHKEHYQDQFKACLEYLLDKSLIYHYAIDEQQTTLVPVFSAIVSSSPKVN